MNDKEILVNVELTIDEINIILEGLGDLPAKKSYNVISKIQRVASESIAEVNKESK